MSLYAYLYGVVYLLVKPLPVSLSCPVGGLGEVDRDILKSAEAHAFRMGYHVVILYGSPESAAVRESHLVTVEYEIRHAVFACYLACILKDFVLVRVIEGVLVYVEVALREGEDVAMAVAGPPYVQHGHGKTAGHFGVFAVCLARVFSPGAYCGDVFHVVRYAGVDVEVE